MTDLESGVALRIPLASQPLIADAVRRAVADFCKQSTAWRERSSAFPIEAGKANYELSDQFDNPICAITDMRVAETQAVITSTTEEMLNARVPGWQLATGRTIFNYLAPTTPDVARLYPVPDTTENNLDVQVAMYANARTTEIPDWIGEMYFDDLIEGACGILLGIRGQQWTDIKASREAEDRLVLVAKSARVRVEKSNTRTPTFMTTTGFDEL